MEDRHQCDKAVGVSWDTAKWHEAKLRRGLSAIRIHQDLAGEHGFDGSYYNVMRFVRG